VSLVRVVPAAPLPVAAALLEDPEELELVDELEPQAARTSAVRATAIAAPIRRCVRR
jgi:protoporphyrinogen oxidase